MATKKKAETVLPTPVELTGEVAGWEQTVADLAVDRYGKTMIGRPGPFTALPPQAFGLDWVSMTRLLVNQLLGYLSHMAVSRGEDWLKANKDALLDWVSESAVVNVDRLLHILMNNPPVVLMAPPPPAPPVGPVAVPTGAGGVPPANPNPQG